jgi:hypothetical protein
MIQSTEYTWDPWDQHEYEERLKQSYHVLRDELE